MRNDHGNVELKDGFKQVCVIEGLIIGRDKIEEFENSIQDNFGTKAQYLEEISTFPNTDSNGNVVSGTGGRNDVFFAIHNDDIGKFSVPRLQYRIRWIEDVLAKCNYSSRIYPERVFKYWCWPEEGDEGDGM